MDRYTIKTKYGWGLNANLRVCGDVNIFNSAIDVLGAYEDTKLTPEQIAATLTENELLKAEIFKLAIRDGGTPCEWCESGNDNTDDMCQVCQDNEFKLFECGLMEG